MALGSSYRNVWGFFKKVGSQDSLVIVKGFAFPLTNLTGSPS